MSALTTLLDTFRSDARSEREKGTYFEELMLGYFQHEPMYRELYAEVLTYGEWAKRVGKDGRDVGSPSCNSMDQAAHNKVVSFIWGIADEVLRDLGLLKGGQR